MRSNGCLAFDGGPSSSSGLRAQAGPFMDNAVHDLFAFITFSSLAPIAALRTRIHAWSSIRKAVSPILWSVLLMGNFRLRWVVKAAKKMACPLL